MLQVLITAILKCDGIQQRFAHNLLEPAINHSSLDDLALDRKTSNKLIWLLFAYSRWICSRCSCCNRAGDSAGCYISGCDSTQGEVFSESTAQRSDGSHHCPSLLSRRHLQPLVWSPFSCIQASRRSTSRDTCWPFLLQHPSSPSPPTLYYRQYVTTHPPTPL